MKCFDYGLPARTEKSSDNVSQMETLISLNFSKLIEFVYLGFPGWGRCDLHAIEAVFQGLVWIKRIQSNPDIFKLRKHRMGIFHGSPWVLGQAGAKQKRLAR